MKTIDHRILIPSPPDHIWALVSDLSRNPDWQEDCREVIFLTSKRSGAGLRWRTSDDKRREYVYEVSAWYEGLGYEYYFVDGAGFRDARGRIRLQDTPEGTIVQWTLSYESAGLIGGVRDGALDRLMQDSLRKLYSISKATKSTPEEPPKSLMRDAPDVNARQTYQPRHPTRDTASAAPNTPRPTLPTAPQPVNAPGDPVPVWRRERPEPAPEPPVEVSDTRPNPAATRASGEFDAVGAALGDDHEPEFVQDLLALARFEPPPPAEATQPSGRAIQTDAPDSPVEERLAPAESALSVPQPAVEPVYTPAPPTPPRVPVVTEQLPPRVLETETAPASPYESPPTPPRVPKVVVSSEAAPPLPIPSREIDDTRSIWEIFNVPRPTGDSAAEQPDPHPIVDSSAPPTEPTAEVTQPYSEAAPEAALVTAPEAALPADAAPPMQPPLAVVTLPSGMRGLRQAIRGKSVRVRRPY